MTVDAFRELLRGYAGAVLGGVCRDPQALELASFVSQGTVFLAGKVSERDFDALVDSNAYQSLRAIFLRAGEVVTDEQGQPFKVSFQFYDHGFEGLTFAPASAAAGRGLAAVAPVRGRGKRAVRSRRNGQAPSRRRARAKRVT